MQVFFVPHHVRMRCGVSRVLDLKAGDVLKQFATDARVAPNFG
jgi:hypothetical protein